ncbi:MAG: universal stress protein [Vicingaceae bacterium]
MKKPFNVNKILIPIDFSETSKLALEHAANLCKKFNSKLHLLHVYTSSNVDVLPNLTATNANESNDEKLKKLITEELNDIGAEFKNKYNVDYQIEVREGKISKEISLTAVEAKADMIVMGTHGVSGFEEFFLGSNAYRTVTSSSVPVLTIQKHIKKMGYDKIVMPVDASKHTRDKASQVAAIAKAFDSTVYIAALISEDHEEEEKIFNLKVKQLEEFFDEKGVKHQKKVIHGKNIADMTLEYSSEIGADLTVVMTEQEAATGLFVGPYAQTVVNHSKIPILSVTPIEVIQSFSQDNLAGDYRPFYV